MKELATGMPSFNHKHGQKRRGGEVTIARAFDMSLFPFGPWNINDSPICCCIIVKPVYIPYIFCNKSDFSLTFSVKNLGSLQIILFFLRELQKMLNVA